MHKDTTSKDVFNMDQSVLANSSTRMLSNELSRVDICCLRHKIQECKVWKESSKYRKKSVFQKCKYLKMQVEIGINYDDIG